MSDFKSFLVDNGIIAVTAGITIGFATATFVKSFVADVILPVIFLVFVKGSSTVSKGAAGFFAKFLEKKEFLYVNFVSEAITWLLIVLCTFWLLSVVHKHYIQRKPVAQESRAGSGMINTVQETMHRMNPFAGSEHFSALGDVGQKATNFIQGTAGKIFGDSNIKAPPAHIPTVQHFTQQQAQLGASTPAPHQQTSGVASLAASVGL